MKKQFLCNSNDFRDELNCSSIRINAEQQQAYTDRKQEKRNNLLTVGPKLKKYEENEIVGFQMSLEISDNGENCLELMRSKSTRDYRRPNPQQKLLVSKREKEANVSHANSLYNTTSFDEMTMNITTNTQKPNSTQMHNNTTENEEESGCLKTLHKPSELARFRETSFDEKMTINISRCKNSHEQHEQKLKNSNALLEGLKKSMGGDEPSRAFEQPSFEQPYFKVGSAFHLTPKFQPQPNKLFVQDHRRELKKVTSVDPPKGQKKLTLRDYMYLSKLSGKNRQKSNDCPSPTTPNFSRTATLGSSRSKRKIVPSNYQVMRNLKKEVVANIELVQGNMDLLLEFIDKSPMDDEITNEELMKMYSLARILRDKIVSGNDELVVMLQGSKE